MLILYNNNTNFTSPMAFSRFILDTKRSFSNGEVEEVYLVNGEQLTVSQIRMVKPSERSVAHWLVLIDWDLQNKRPFVIVDPFDPSGILYLSEQQYLVQQRTLGKLDAPFTIIARPGSKKPTPIKTPPTPFSLYYVPGFHHLTWRDFKELRSQIARNIKWGANGTVEVDDSNIVPLILLWGRNLLHYEGIRHPEAAHLQFLEFAKYLQRLNRAYNTDTVILHLKTMLIALYSYVGGNPLKTTESLGHRVALASGLPKCFGRPVRESIRHGNLSRVRIWASILNVYKYLKGSHPEPPLTSIQAPPFEGDLSEFKTFVEDPEGGFWGRLALQVNEGNPIHFKYKSSFGMIISTAGANHSQAMASLPWDAEAWKKSGRDHILTNWFKMWGDGECADIFDQQVEESVYYTEVQSWALHWRIPKGSRYYEFKSELEHLFPTHRRKEQFLLLKEESPKFWNQTQSLARVLTLVRLIQPSPPVKVARGPSGPPVSNSDNLMEVPPILLAKAFFARAVFGEWPCHLSQAFRVTGRLWPLKEAAGKVRVVAICDYFTQLALKPVHDNIFDLLRHIPTDATFAQEERTKWFADKGYKDLWSYDLKSATDLIPKELYPMVLKNYFNKSGAPEAWLDIISNRDFYVSPEAFDINHDETSDGPYLVRYTRGQPMGAYSSWAGLALVHHALVQFAASRCGVRGWFTGYLVLGDDITIADEGVSREYLNICASYGITIGLAKSYISKKGLFNFAAQVYLGQENISPMSLKEEIVSDSFGRRLEFAKRMDRRWGLLAPADTPGSLRRLVPYAQWQEILLSSVGLGRSQLFAGLQFCLSNPFLKDGVDIGKICHWLGYLQPVFRRLPLNTQRRFETYLVEELFAILKTRIDSYLMKVNTLIALMEDLWGLPKGVLGTNTPYGRKSSWVYVVNHCYLPKLRFGSLRTVRFLRDNFIYKHIDERTRVMKSQPSIEDLWWAFDSFKSMPKIEKSWLSREYLRRHIFVVMSGIAFSQENSQDKRAKRVVRPTVGWLAKLAPPRPVESINAPINELMLASVKTLGVVLPLQRLASKRPSKPFTQALRTLVEEIRSTGVSTITREWKHSRWEYTWNTPGHVFDQTFGPKEDMGLVQSEVATSK